MSNILKLGRFQISNLIPVPISTPDLNRNLHQVCLITSGLREFVLIQDFKNPNDVWLNELVGTSVQEIKDDELFKELWKFLFDNQIVSVFADEQQEAERQERFRK